MLRPQNKPATKKKRINFVRKKVKQMSTDLVSISLWVDCWAERGSTCLVCCWSPLVEKDTLPTSGPFWAI